MSGRGALGQRSSHRPKHLPTSPEHTSRAALTGPALTHQHIKKYTEKTEWRVAIVLKQKTMEAQPGLASHRLAQDTQVPRQFLVGMHAAPNRSIHEAARHGSPPPCAQHSVTGPPPILEPWFLTTGSLWQGGKHSGGVRTACAGPGGLLPGATGHRCLLGFEDNSKDPHPRHRAGGQFTMGSK